MPDRAELSPTVEISYYLPICSCELLCQLQILGHSSPACLLVVEARRHHTTAGELCVWKIGLKIFQEHSPIFPNLSWNHLKFYGRTIWHSYIPVCVEKGISKLISLLQQFLECCTGLFVSLWSCRFECQQFINLNSADKIMLENKNYRCIVWIGPQ